MYSFWEFLSPQRPNRIMVSKDGLKERGNPAIATPRPFPSNPGSTCAQMFDDVIQWFHHLPRDDQSFWEGYTRKLEVKQNEK